MNKISKWFGVICFVSLVCLVGKFNYVKANESITWVDVNKEYAFKTSSEYADYCYFRLSEPGRVSITTDGYNYASVIKLDENYDEIAEYVYEEANPDLRLAAGIYKVVALEVGDVIKKVNFTPEGINEQCEEESNNDFESSDLINVNQEYEGDFTVSKVGYTNKEDDDYYKFEIKDKGSFYVTSQIKLDSSSLSDPVLQLYVLDDNGDYDLIQEICEYGVSTYKTNKYRVSAGIYYIKLSYNYMGSYKIKVTYNNESNGYYETENNNDVENATPMDYNRFFTGNLSDENDVDCYRIDLDETSIVEFGFKTSSKASGLYSVEILDEDQNLIGSMESNKKVVKVSDRILGKGSYYIVVKCADDKVNSFTDYQVSSKVEKYVAVKKIVVKGQTTVKQGKKIKLNVVITPNNATIQDVVWKTSDSKIATVSKKGIVTGKKTGTVTISVVSKDNKKVVVKYRIRVTK